jgi:hypothetical protein
LFEGNHGRRRKDFGQLGIFFDRWSHSCGDTRCKCCKHMQHSSSYTSKVTGKQYKIFALLIARVQMLFTFLGVSVVNPKSFMILMLKITPQTVLFNDEDFHSVEFLETVIRESEVLEVTIIPSYLYSEMRKLKIFNTSHFVA